MKAIEFCTITLSEGWLELPEDVVKNFPINQTVRVIVLMEELDDHDESHFWNRLAVEQFFQGYDEADSIYDNIYYYDPLAKMELSGKDSPFLYLFSIHHSSV